eukprot:77117_1
MYLLITIPLITLLAFGKSKINPTPRNCPPLGCNYNANNDKSAEVICKDDGSLSTVIFSGNNGCSNWNYFIDIINSPPNNPCCTNRAYNNEFDPNDGIIPPQRPSPRRPLPPREMQPQHGNNRNGVWQAETAGEWRRNTNGEWERDRSNPGEWRTEIIGDRSFTYLYRNGLKIFEGDIILPEANERRLIPLTNTVSHYWADNYVPYVINGANEDIVNSAIEHWNSLTIITLSPRSNEDDYISFESRDGCWSYIGKQGGEQIISLGDGCDFGAAVHEIGHALGMWHTQGRSDRDEYITIYYDNIEEGKESNFNEHNGAASDCGTYDYGSIMHYSQNAFGKNDDSQTIKPISESGLGSYWWDGTAPFCDGECTGYSAEIKTSDTQGEDCWSGSKSYCVTMGQRDGLSNNDIQCVNQFYSALITVYCDDSCSVYRSDSSTSQWSNRVSIGSQDNWQVPLELSVDDVTTNTWIFIDAEESESDVGGVMACIRYKANTWCTKQGGYWTPIRYSNSVTKTAFYMTWTDKGSGKWGTDIEYSDGVTDIDDPQWVWEWDTTDNRMIFRFKFSDVL